MIIDSKKDIVKDHNLAGRDKKLCFFPAFFKSYSILRKSKKVIPAVFLFGGRRITGHINPFERTGSDPFCIDGIAVNS